MGKQRGTVLSADEKFILTHLLMLEGEFTFTYKINIFEIVARLETRAENVMIHYKTRAENVMIYYKTRAENVIFFS